MVRRQPLQDRPAAHCFSTELRMGFELSVNPAFDQDLRHRDRVRKARMMMKMDDTMIGLGCLPFL